ncbi:MAG: cold shock domain-containing protein, partial [Anaerolineales bacterium]|nr:cold shock domain-containing protein [Anaerolineales bacterium]
AVTAFQKSYELLVKLGDEVGQAMVHFGMGKMYIEQTKFKEAKDSLVTSFEINEKLKIAQGMRIVTPSLSRVLSALDQHDKAKEYAHRALVIVPDDKRLLRLLEQLSENKQVSSVAIKKSGHIKNTIRNLSGYLYGFIIPDDASGDIYFGQDQVDEEIIPKLAEGLSVWVEVEMAARGPRAKRVWLKE